MSDKPTDLPPGHVSAEPFDDNDPDRWHERNLARIRANIAARKAQTVERSRVMAAYQAVADRYRQALARLARS